MLAQDEIVEIPPERIRFFGGTGKMLLPSPATLLVIIASIPPRRLLTTELVRQHLTHRFRVRGTCPVTTQRSMLEAIRYAGSNIPYWRIVKKNGELMASLPDGVQMQAQRLSAEGFVVDHSAKVPRVRDLPASLMKLDC